MNYRYIVVIYLVILCNLTFGQNKKIEQLKAQVGNFNDNLQYEKSIHSLTDFIAEEGTTSYEKYQAYLMKSYTYKRLFNYPKTLYYIDQALQEGLKSDKKNEVINSIKAEKSFVYFDTHEYEKANVLMKELSETDYAYLHSDDKVWVIMQEGYLLMQNKQYLESEKKLNECIAILKDSNPKNLPNIYGKKIELYNEMKQFQKRDEAFKLGLYYAKKHKVIKYEMYIYEIMRNGFQKSQDYKRAFQMQSKYDSINAIYNSINNNGKIEILEKKLEDEKEELLLKNEKYKQYILYGLISFLLISLYISYKLYKVNKERRILAEKENVRIHNEIERLTIEIDERGDKKLNLSLYDLTDRQKEIIHLIQEGKSNKEIASQLFVSENTIKYHLKVIYEILDIEHRTELKK